MIRSFRRLVLARQFRFNDVGKNNSNSSPIPPRNDNNENGFSGHRNPAQVSTNSSDDALARLRSMEERQKSYDKQFDYRQYFKNLQMPLLIAAGSLLTYYLWKSKKLDNISRHLSINEYTIQNNYWHTLITSAVSFKTDGQLLAYFPPMVLSLLMLARRFRTRHFISTFLLNSLICGFSTMMYEKNYSLSQEKLMIPKIGGCYTALMFMSCFATISPGFGILGSRYLPFWFVPVMFGFYEYQEHKDAIVHEVSRPSHLIGLLNGVVFGLILGRFGALTRL